MNRRSLMKESINLQSY